MAKPVEIKRIDLIVHPFYLQRNLALVLPKANLNNGPVPPYSREQGKKLLEIWKKSIDEAAADQNRLLLIVKANLPGTEWQEALKRELYSYAKKRLGKRFGFFRQLYKSKPIFNCRGKGYKTFKAFARNNGFELDPLKVKTRSFGEYTDQCVTDYLIGLNRFVGMKKGIPYRNSQSAVSSRKSVSLHLRAWEIEELMKTPAGRAKLGRKAMQYARSRRRKANRLARQEREFGRMEFDGKNYFKPRTRLMKKRPRA